MSSILIQLVGIRLYMTIVQENELLQSLGLHIIHCKMLIVSVFARLLSFTQSQASDDLHTGEPSTTSLYNGPHQLLLLFFSFSIPQIFIFPSSFKLKISLDDSCKMKKEAVLSNGKMNKLGIWNLGLQSWHYTSTFLWAPQSF